MILTTKKQQLEFLKECYEHINRIFNTYLTDSEKRDANPDSGFNTPNMSISDDKLDTSNLPKSIEFGGWLRNVKMGKLYLLVKIYNKTAEKIEADEQIDLQEFFPEIKRNADYELRMRIHSVSDYVMATHRSHFLRSGFFSFLARFFRPKSETFLKKYGFFESKLDLPLNEAIEKGDIKKIASLASASTVNQRDGYGFGSLPLSIAAFKGDLEIIKLLIDKGAEVNSEALGSAAGAGNIEIINFLLSQGARVDARTLNVAIRVGDTKVVRLLLQNGGDVNEADANGITPLRESMGQISYGLSHKDETGSKWHARVHIIEELLKHPIEWEKHEHNGQSIFECAEKARERLITNWPEHPNREGFERVCEVIRNEQPSSSYNM